MTVQEKEQRIRAGAEKKVQRLYEREQKKTQMIEKRKKERVIPIFYASDDNYLPYLAVSLQSLKENADKNYRYEVYILTAGASERFASRVQKYADERFCITFVDVGERLDEVKRDLQLRDYYTGATYYRIFIAGMFPQYDKALYLDGDTVVLGDIAKLYNANIHDNYVGAVTDGVVSSANVFKRYTKEVLGIEATRYFNAGVLVMNLKKFREDDFYSQFRSLLLEYKFSVAQDQDYLNVLCKDKVQYLSQTWNTMPVSGEKTRMPALIHYNLTAKPWRYASIPYARVFWRFAEQNEFSHELRCEFGACTPERREKDALSEQGLMELANREIAREDNFIRARRMREKQTDGYVLTAKQIFEV